MEMTTKDGRREWTHGRWRIGFEGRMKGVALNVPPGEWDREPDKVQWVDPATDFDCLMVRNWWGAWCGYVGVAEGHPLYEVKYALVAMRDVVLRVHGGVTFAGFCHEPTEEEWTKAETDLTLGEWLDEQMARRICHVPELGRPEKVWWIGFDCGHHGDLQPTMAATMREVLGRDSVLTREPSVYRNVAYVEGQVTMLAAQLRELQPGETK